MDSKEKQGILLQIVRTWQLGEKPEYRGFRCGYCQKYNNKAWHHWISFNNYKLSVHLCNNTCESLLQNDFIQIDELKKELVDKKVSGNSYKYPSKTIKRFREIVRLWPKYKEPKLMAYACDDCNKKFDIDKTSGICMGYHVWWMDDNHTLTEFHFHKKCATSLGIKG